MIREYINNVNATQDSWFSSDPYYYLRIDSIMHGSGRIQQHDFTSFTPQYETETSNSDDYKNTFSWVELKKSLSYSSMTFTKSITLPADGRYLIEIMVRKLPTASGSFDLSIDGTSVWSETAKNDWDTYGTVLRAPIQELTAGSKSFVFTLPKYARAGWIKISQLTRLEGGTEIVRDSENRLDVLDIEFTMNGVNQIDTATIKVAMKEDYWSDERGMNPMVFDALDHVTLVLGQNRQSAIPMFGGYISGWALNEEMSELTIYCVDRTWDLKRAMVWRNFSIGYIPKDDGSGSMPYSQFSSVNNIARYLCTSLYQIDFSGIEKEYIYYNNFSNIGDVDNLSRYGFDLAWETSFGHPGTCMRVIPQDVYNNYITLYSSEGGEWDAAEFNHFNFEYYASGAGVKYPVTFNIEIDMYKKDAEVSTAKTYYITFTGKTGTSTGTYLGSVSPKLNGEWQSFIVDLKAMFDKVSPSTGYLIKEIRLKGDQSTTIAMNRRCSSIYIDQITAYKEIASAPKYASADAKTAYDELVDLCDKTSHIAYIRPGMERADDQLILLPKRYYTLPVQLTPSNAMKISGLEYKPLDWGMTNWAVDSYKDGNQNSQYISYQDSDHVKHFGPIMNHEFMSDVTDATAAKSVSVAKVDDGVSQYPGFTATIIGSVLVEPGQNMIVKLPQFHLDGVYELVSLVHKLDIKNGMFTSELGFGVPSMRFSKMVKTINDANRDLRTIRNSLTYMGVGAMAAGLETSLGAYGN